MTEPHREPSPPSWLELERHALGELPAERASVVERALREDPETRACFELATEPVALRPLPDIPSVRPLPARPAKRAPVAWAWARLYWLAPLAAAAALVLFLARVGDEPHADFPGPRVRVKGGDVAVTLVRDRGGSVTDRPTTFAPGDRFKVLLTCPPGLEGSWDVAVIQGRDVFFPLDPAEVTACGNESALPGAFSLDGREQVTVCVVRQGAARIQPADALAGRLGEGAACAVLEAGP